MLPIDFGLSVFASWLANQIGKTKEVEPPKKQPVNDEQEEINKRHKLFKTYDVYTEAGPFIETLLDPVAHFVIEKDPSTFYNLSVLVLESRVTGEWVVFRRGRMSFQGTGGGYKQSERIIHILKSHNVPLAVWATNQEILNTFEAGHILWGGVKASLVPLVSSIVEQSEWEWIQKTADELIKDNAAHNQALAVDAEKAQRP